MRERLHETLQKNTALISGGQMVDDYNRTITTDGISICISTRINACNHYWLLTDGNDKDTASN